MPRIVKPPLPFSPHACLVTGTIDGEFIDFERDFIGMDPRIVLRKEVVEEAARECCNMVPLHEVEEMRRQVGELGQKLDDALSDLNLTKDFESKFSQSLEAGVTSNIKVENSTFEEAEDGINIETATPAGEEGSN